MTDEAVTVTLKFDKGYEAPWLVLKGQPSEVEANLANLIGVNVGELSLIDLISKASKIAQSHYAISDQLGGEVVVTGKKAKPKAKADPKPEAETDVKPEAETDDANNEDDVTVAIAEAASGDELRAVLKKYNKRIKASAKYKEAYKSRMSAFNN